MSTQKLAMVIDSAKCIDCKGCMAACKQANGVSRGVWRNWIKEATPPLIAGADGTKKLGRGHFQPGACMHCDEPSCIQACPTGATYRTKDGVVLIDHEYCIGCRYCVQACPYGARYFNEEKGVTDKCTWCYHRITKGLQPACVEVCPVGARVFGDIKDKQSPISLFIRNNRVQVLKPETGNAPNVYYVGIDKEVS